MFFNIVFQVFDFTNKYKMDSDIDAKHEEQKMNNSNRHGKEHNDEKDSKNMLLPNKSSVVAIMPSERNAIYYNMNHKKRGMALIFNHNKFDNKEGYHLSRRLGTDVDCANLNNVLKSLDFEVIIYRDLKYNELSDRISEVSKLDHTDNDCILITVLSHGGPGVLYAEDSAYKPEMLWLSFTADKCPTLAGKPKLFFIQASYVSSSNFCQDDMLDTGLTLINSMEMNEPGPTTYRIPILADFLISYSTVPGFNAMRDTVRGSWFIQALSEELRYYGKGRDMLTLLTFVSQRVAYDFEVDTPYMHQQKQIPYFTSMLTRLLVFGEK